MSGGPDPDWELLDRDAVRFFGLVHDYAPEDLRKAYIGLIRRFRPERDPEAFQRIRRAYEILVQYGIHSRTLPEAEPALRADGGKPTGTESFATVRESLSVEDPGTILARLEGRNDLTASQATVRLLLRDAIRPLGEGEFTGALLDLLGEFPRDPGLRALVTAQAATGVPRRSTGKFLRVASRRLPVEAYLAATLPAWRWLGASGSPKTFRDLLDGLQDYLAGAWPAGRGHFLEEVLRAGAWRADADWLASRVEDLAQDHEAARGLAGSIDLLEALVDYRRFRVSLTADCPILATLDGAIRARLERDPEDAQDVFHRAMVELAREDTTVLASFPSFLPGCAGGLRILDLMARERDDSIPGRGDPEMDAMTRRKLVNLFTELDRSLPVRLFGVVDGALRWLVVVFRVILVAAGVGILIKAQPDVLEGEHPVLRTILWVSGAGALLVATLLFRFTRLPALLARARRSVRGRLYRSSGRRRVARFLRAWQIPPGVFRTVAGPLPEGGPWETYVTLIESDPGMRVLAVAYRFGA